MTKPTDKEMMADMIRVALTELGMLAKESASRTRDATIALCRMLEVAPEPWQKPVAEKLRRLETHGFVMIPGQYRRLVRRALEL